MRRGGAAATGLVLLAALCLAYYAVRQQQAANREILSRLGDVQSALRDQSLRAAELGDQVSALAERVGRLEAENRDLRRQVAALLRRKPSAEVAINVLPQPLDAAARAPFAEHSSVADPLPLIEPIPITWDTDWSSYQPAGIVAPAPQIVLERRLEDPALLRTLYYSYGALQAADALTTLVSLGRGARELNPLVKGAAGNPAGIFAVKGAAVAATILTVERLRKTHPAAVTVSLIAINATLAMVAVNNAAVAAKQERP